MTTRLPTTGLFRFQVFLTVTRPSAPGARAPTAAARAADEALAALRRMPGRQREALVLRYYADLPEAQAAAAMGVSTAAFRGHAARGIRALRSEAYAPAPHPQGLSTPHPRLVCLTHNAVHSMSSCCAQRYPQAR